MSRAIVFTIIVLFFNFSFALAQFYGTTWGDNQEQVIKKVGAGYQKNGPDQVIYKKTIGGKESYIGFVFVENKLVKGMFILDEEHTNKNFFIDDYNEWKTLVREKFGAPNKDEVVWVNDMFKSTPKESGTAISMGHLVMYSMFRSSDTEVTAFIQGDNYKVDVKVQYISIKYKSLVDRIKASDF